LGGAGCTKIFREKVTGARGARRELLKMLHALEKGFAASFLPCLRVHAAIFASRLRWLGPFVSAAFNAASRRPLGPFVSAALNPACRRVLCVSATIGSEQPGN